MANPPSDAFVEPLTPRELDVLQLLADGLSNQEIAEALVFEVGTVKWYNTQIYGKLQVKNRKEAVTRARTLGILEADADDPLQRLQHNLPVDTLPFVGRASEIDDLVEQMTREAVRLVTILGPGGMGKTRLSIEVGRRLLGHFLDGVYFVPLAPVDSSEHIVTTIAEIIDLKFHSDVQPKEQLTEYLQAQRMLLIIDNFEHLLDHAGLLTDILNAAPQVKIVATSREKLGLSGEVVYVISGLSTPYEEKTEAIDHDAVKLFMDAANRTSALENDLDINLVATICQMLGGMPLGILLAAAWIDTLNLSEIKAEISSGLGILESTLRDAPQRHQSIEAVFDYSWKRLSDDEQGVFMRLSVFRDGFTREAAQAVTDASLRDLQRLVHTSFIQHLPSGRYAIHELMRQYGEEKLAELGERETFKAKHAGYFAGMVSPIGEMAWLLGNDDVLDVLTPDFENVRASWYFYLGRKDLSGLRQLLNGIWAYLDQHSRSQEALDLFEAALDTFSNDPSDDIHLFRGQILTYNSWFYADLGLKTKAVDLIDQAVEIVRPTENMVALLPVISCEAIMAWQGGDTERAMELCFEGHKRAEEINHIYWQRTFSQQIATAYATMGNYQDALHWAEQAVDTPGGLVTKGQVLNQLGDYAQARECLLAVLQKNRHHRYSIAITYSSLMENAVFQGDNEQAWHYLQRGLGYVDSEVYRWAALDVLSMTPRLFMAEQRHETAVEILSLIVNHPNTMGMTRQLVKEYEDSLKATLTPNDFDAAWERGKHIDVGELINEIIER